MSSLKEKIIKLATGIYRGAFGVWVYALIIGVLTAYAGHLLHLMVKACNNGAWVITDLIHSGPFRILLIFLLPFLGISLSLFVQKEWGGRHFAKSLTPLIFSLARRKEKIPLSETITHLLSSALSVGFGGSAGLEAPSVLAGAAIGSNVARFFRSNKVPGNILVGCGAAAAISAIFDSPIGGVLFVVEALLPEFTVTALVPLVLSSATSSLVSELLEGRSVFFMSDLSKWNRGEVLPMFLCGIFCAVIGAFVIRSIVYSSRKLEHYLRTDLQRLFVGSFIVCSILLIFPSLRGQGYEAIEQLLINDDSVILDPPELLSGITPWLVPALLLIASIFVKPVVSSLTVEAGGDGGIFAPTLFIGAFTGFAFAKMMNATGWVNLHESNFAALGMCGVFTAVMRAPLAGIFLVAETTGGYELLPPLMIVSSISWISGRLLEPQSIYRKSLYEKHLLSNDEDLTRILCFEAGDCMRKMSLTIHPEMSLEDALELVRGGGEKPEVYPVVDDNMFVVGLLPVERLLAVALEEKGDVPVRKFMVSPRAMIFVNDTLDEALASMEACHIRHIPVVDRDKKCLGTISKDDVFDKYRLAKKEF